MRFVPRWRRAIEIVVLTAAIAAIADVRFLYADGTGPLASSLVRAARETARNAPREQARRASRDDGRQRDADAAAGKCGASWAEKTAWAYLLVGGSVFIVTSPGEKNADGSWSRDGKAEMAAGVGAVAISFALLRDILRK